MTPELYRSWILPAHRVLSQAILCSYRLKSRRILHRRREPCQLVLIPCK